MINRHKTFRSRLPLPIAPALEGWAAMNRERGDSKHASWRKVLG